MPLKELFDAYARPEAVKFEYDGVKHSVDLAAPDSEGLVAVRRFAREHDGSVFETAVESLRLTSVEKLDFEQAAKVIVASGGEFSEVAVKAMEKAGLVSVAAIADKARIDESPLSSGGPSESTPAKS